MTTAWYEFPITHGYLPSSVQGDSDSPHFAVDIGMPVDTPITAIKSGTVEQSDYAVWAGKQGGGEVWIRPDDGSPEYYFYHLDQNMVTSGQHVSQGQEVGLSGGQNSGGHHNTDPSWSTGPHLHVGYFTSFKDTPIGTRPYGPDITPTINQLKIGGLPETNTIPNVDANTVGGLPIGQLGKIGGIFLIGIVLFIVGGAFMIGGSHGLHGTK